jgi:hypothetical protein
MYQMQIRVVVISAVTFACAARSSAETPIERGKYLVENVSVCGDCHTAKVDGKPDPSKPLKGSTLGFQPIGEIRGWHKTAPDIASASPLFQRWGDDGFKKFMETGKNPRGGSADPPMPQYRFTAEDADAIVQYLKTVK